jgi:hypothetical protein
MPSLRDLQQRFADALFAPPGTAPEFALAGPANTDAAARIDIYRNAIFANYRRALQASFPVVARLVGTPFFDAAVDAFVRARPSTRGDLNVYGSDFGDFLSAYPDATELPYLADIARLEWAVDEAQRAADSLHAPADIVAALAAIAPERLSDVRLRLAPSVRLVASTYPILRIWQVNQPAHEGDDHVSLGEGADALVVHRSADAVTIARVAAAEHAFLAALAQHASVGDAIDAAEGIDPRLDLGAALRAHVTTGVIAAVDAA